MTTPPSIDIRVIYDAREIRRAYIKFFLWTQFGWLFGFIVLAGVGIAASLSRSGGYAWIGGLFVGVSFYYLYSVAASWRGAMEGSLERAGKEMAVSLTPTRIEFKGEGFESIIDWNKLQQAGDLGGTWFLSFSSNYVALPRSAVTPEADAYIRARLKERKIPLARWADNLPAQR